MANCVYTILGLLIVQYCVRAAPSNITSVEEVSMKEEPEITTLEESIEVPESEETVEVPEEPKLDSQPLIIEENKYDDNSTQSPRQKRFYNLFGYGLPPVNPGVYPGYNKRDQSAETGVYGLVEDPLEQIQRRLQDIASFVRQPVPPPPPPTHFPFYFPVIYIPQYECDCNFDNDKATPPPQPEKPQTPSPENNQTNPEPDKRFPDLSDDRLNWGLVTNDTNTQFDEFDEDEFNRPISFDPIDPNRPMRRPSPPVEHGSSQGNSAETPKTTTTARPNSNSRRPSTARPPLQDRPVLSAGLPAPYPPSFSNNIPRDEQPSSCDGAVLTCCHRPQVTYDCFVAQSCPDPTPYGNPCDSLVILQVIQKFQRYYGVRDGK